MTHSNRLRSAIAASIAFVAASSVALPASAGGVDTLMTAKVGYADLDLSHEAGVRVLYARIHSAAENVCSPFAGRDTKLNGTWSKCVDDATSEAVASTRVPALAELYAAKSGKPLAGKVASLTR